jgi:hypothetical protein
MPTLKPAEARQPTPNYTLVVCVASAVSDTAATVDAYASFCTRGLELPEHTREGDGVPENVAICILSTGTLPSVPVSGPVL